MRLFAAAVISIGLLGGLSAYMHVKARWRVEVPVYEPPAASGVYSIEVTPSFSTQRDPFALDLGEAEDAPATLKVSLGERIVLRQTGAIEAGETLRAEPVDGIRIGKNQLHLSVAVPEDKLTGSHAVRLRILRDGVQVADETVWSEPGQPVSGEVTLEVAPFEQVEEPHDHD